MYLFSALGCYEREMRYYNFLIVINYYQHFHGLVIVGVAGRRG